ncbi:hypothetical protein GobsT_55700 [Gemmata obscuriglobus]|uniref:DUF58 domain-containing protein n=1 Tax=Gemmata obscuriglobus TaxID=114 RepID=A0A2Z3GX03_9BACT|nr:DUF58 domain-containing protein [Gemmata obscuriglobus]AWM36612.1 DUF58 domain-containing protein [Gemmata obscuriglobus]QEG30758.1 hypothetical protein GobsT_55700 [Gemmata obscuriglobus]VTS10088.1 Uncharacterized protein OS=Singulisphaera acidiphila (strain ATCC BAA-1392 / DSM 18658 / VKM B-2454 / MOB10) GN=Sinac_2134 PE=4 SV=1: DUF58 [Gemmata obscuriglobus UQM 2246]
MSTVDGPVGRLRRLASHDFFPSFSTKVRRVLYNPLGVLIGAAGVSLACGLFLHAQGFVLAGGIVAVVGLGVLWPWLSLRGLTGAVDFDRPRAAEGDTIGVRLMLRNRLPWAVWGLTVRDGFGEGAERPAAAVASTPGRRAAACRWTFVPEQRGVYPLAPPRLCTGFPFGLWENARRLEIGAPLAVWPRTFPVGPVPPVSGDRQVEGNVSRVRVGTTGDVLGVRPYRRGDSPRRIHWGQSAKHDRLVVCELQSNARPVIQIVLDANPLVHAGAGTNGSREWAVRVAASLAKGWLEAGAQVGLTWTGFELPPASGTAQVHKLLDALAALPNDAGGPLADLLACPVCRGFRDGLQVVVTTDRSHTHAACGACVTESQRWVVLTAGGFSDTVSIASHACDHAPGAEPWLRIDSADEAPARLRGGWKEARHGS